MMAGQRNNGRIHVMHVVRHGFAGGGMENGIINVANGIAAERYRVSVCSLDSRETFSERIRHGDAQYPLLPKRGRGIDWGLVWRLARLLRCSDVDLVHSHNWASFLYAVLAAKWARVPIVHGEHGKNAGELDENNRAKFWAKSLLGRRVDRLVTVSQALADEWAGYGVPQSKIRWIPNGVDVERFRPRAECPEDRLKFGLPQGALVIGSVGRMDALKNYEVLIHAFARVAGELPLARLALMGEGPCEPRLRQTAENLGISSRVHWLGRRPDPEIFLPALDIFVLPSKTEGMSNVVLEAMASGLPVVCADLPCHHEVFEAGRQGLVVSPCDAETLSGTLAVLCGDPALRQNLGSAARERAVARFNITRMVADYERLYSESARPRLGGGLRLSSAPPEDGLGARR